MDLGEYLQHPCRHTQIAARILRGFFHLFVKPQGFQQRNCHPFLYRECLSRFMECYGYILFSFGPHSFHATRSIESTLRNFYVLFHSAHLTPTDYRQCNHSDNNHRIRRLNTALVVADTAMDIT